jgi:hypothetical protein
VSTFHRRSGLAKEIRSGFESFDFALESGRPYLQPAGLNNLSLEAGNRSSLAAGRRGRATSSPPQFGQRPCSAPSAQLAQNVHSNEQMRASVESGGKSLSQHSQPGRSSSMAILLRRVYSGSVSTVIE